MRNLVALVSAGAAAQLLTGCLPFGCGAPSDPTNVATFALTLKATATSPLSIGGVAAAPDGVWMLEDGPEVRSLAEYDHVGGRELHRMVLDTSDAFGLAWDGTALWVGTRQAGAASAWRIDPSTGARLALVSLPTSATDLAWDGAELLVTQGVGDFEGYAPTSGALVEAVPVHRLDRVDTVAYADGETWVGQSGNNNPLVYDSTGTLLAIVETDAFPSSDAHMAFVGGDLVVVQGTSLRTYSIDRTVPPPPVR
jgi:hypothetical protein